MCGGFTLVSAGDSAPSPRGTGQQEAQDWTLEHGSDMPACWDGQPFGEEPPLIPPLCSGC